MSLSVCPPGHTLKTLDIVAIPGIVLLSHILMTTYQLPRKKAIPAGFQVLCNYKPDFTSKLKNDIQFAELLLYQFLIFFKLFWKNEEIWKYKQQA